MNAALIFKLLQSRTEAKSSLRTPDEATLQRESQNIVRCLPGHANIKINLISALDTPMTLTGLNCSSSIKGKFLVMKNNAVLSTLFNSDRDLSVFHQSPITVLPGDSIDVIVHSREPHAADFYVGFDLA